MEANMESATLAEGASASNNDAGGDDAFFKKNMFIFCDGTWCGQETGTNTNIRILYEYVRMQSSDDRCAYFSGIGVGGDELDYIVNGALAVDLKNKCIEVYRYIVKNFDSNVKIWMFGLSRGAFTVRSVAGMINNLGILLPVHNTLKMCTKVFDLYKYDLRMSDLCNHRPDLPLWHPKSEAATEFRERNCHRFSDPKNPPIFFMGLFDTVGALGVPVHFGEHVPYEFYDTVVSSSVKNVYQCAAIHDRLLFFQPCSISRNPKVTLPPGFHTEECWVPGCHYDVGRQHFKFGIGFLTWVTRGLKLLHHDIPEIMPNHVYANVALDWMVGKMLDRDFPDPHRCRQVAPPPENQRVSDVHWDGDVYDKLLKYYGLEKYKTYILGDRILPLDFTRARFDGSRSVDYKSTSLQDYSFLYPNATEHEAVRVNSFNLAERIPVTPPENVVKTFFDTVGGAVKDLWDGLFGWA